LTPQKSAPVESGRFSAPTFQPQPIRPAGMQQMGMPRPSTLLYDPSNNHFKPISPQTGFQNSPNPGQQFSYHGASSLPSPNAVQISPNPAYHNNSSGQIRPNTPNGPRNHSPLTVIHEETEEKLLKELKFDLVLAQVLTGIAKLHSRELCGDGLQVSVESSDEKSSESSNSGGSKEINNNKSDLSKNSSVSNSQTGVNLQLSQTMKNSFTDKYVSEVLGTRTDSVILYEKIALYYKAVEHIAASINRARNLVSGGEIKKSSRFKEVCMALAKLFQKTGDFLNEAKQGSADLLNHSHYTSNGSLALENDDLERENVTSGTESDSSSSCKEEEIIRSPDKLIFVYALSLSLHSAGVEITLGTSSSSPKMRKRSDSDNGPLKLEIGGGDKVDKTDSGSTGMINMSKSTQNLVNCYEKAFTLFRSLDRETGDGEAVRKQQLGDYLKAIQLRIYALSGRASPGMVRRARRTSTRMPRSRQGSTSSLENYYKNNPN
jgi:hypothetical protein